VAVAAVPWVDTTTVVRNTDLWRAVFPASTSLKLASDALLPHHGRELATLGSLTLLDLTACYNVTDALIARLPRTLRALNVSHCSNLSQDVSFTHLKVLQKLDCSGTAAVEAGLPGSLRKLYMRGCEAPREYLDFSSDDMEQRRMAEITQERYTYGAASIARLPPWLEVLDVSKEEGRWDWYHETWPPDWSAAHHLTRLRVLKAAHTHIDDSGFATVPPSLRVLALEGCAALSEAASFPPPPRLHTLILRDTPISTNTLVTLPPSLMSLDLHLSGRYWTPATVFAHLPALRELNVNHSNIGNAAVASMPASLEELHLVCCSNVTRRARLKHLAALRVLQSSGSDLSRTRLAACRARGCFAPADGRFADKDGWMVTQLAAMPGGRLVSSTFGGRVTLWEAAAAGLNTVAELELRGLYVHALTALPDGHRVAVGTHRGIVVWDPRGVPTVAIEHPTVATPSGVCALAAIHTNGVPVLVAGCFDGKLRVVAVSPDPGSVVAALETSGKPVTAVAALPDGRVASTSDGGGLMVWDVSTGECVLSLDGAINSLAVLSDGRLAGGSWGSEEGLLDFVVGGDVRICMLTSHTRPMAAVTALPGNRLASVAADGTIRVWDTRDVGGGIDNPECVIEFGSNTRLIALAPLPGNRLAAGGDGGVHVWQLPPPS